MAKSPQNLCRICLETDVRMFDIADTVHKLTFETLMRTSLMVSCKPTVVCYLCKKQLVNGRALQYRALLAEEFFMTLPRDMTEVTSDLVGMIERQSKNLCTKLKTAPIKYFDTYTFDGPIKVKDKSDMKSEEFEDKPLSQNMAMCRLCLAMDMRTFPIAGTQLQFVYESLTNSVLHTADKRPVSTCYICYAKLKKCRDLMLRSDRAESVLTAMLEKYSEVSTKLLSSSEHQVNSLHAILRIKPVEFYDSTCEAVEKKTGVEAMSVEVKVEVDPDLYVGETEMESQYDADELRSDARVEAWELDVNSIQQGGASIAKSRPRRRRKRADKTEKADPNVVKEKPRRVYKKRIRAYIHQCNICQRMFNRTNHLKDHMKTHTDDRPYECEYCKRRFIQKINFKNHLMTHTGEKPFECEICLSSFIAKSDFKRHMNTHNEEKNFVCTVCNRRFTQMPYLKAHIGIHTDEKPYECHICQRRFSQKPYLKNHLKRHVVDNDDKSRNDFVENCNSSVENVAGYATQYQEYSAPAAAGKNSSAKAYSHSQDLY